jgi:hypothetical protein
MLCPWCVNGWIQPTGILCRTCHGTGEMKGMTNLELLEQIKANPTLVEFVLDLQWKIKLKPDIQTEHMSESTRNGFQLLEDIVTLLTSK